MKFEIPVEKARLKPGVLPHYEQKGWEIQTTLGGLVLLRHPSLNYTLGVSESCIESDGLNDEK